MRLQLALSLLVTLAAASSAHADPDDTQVSSDVLLYTDTDNVVVVSPQVAARQALDEDGGEVSARYVLDAITAASADVVSSATYRFSELRNEVDLAASKSFGPWLPAVSYRYSHEPDYQSHGATIGSTRELAGGDTTVGVTIGATIDAVGRTGTPSSAFSERLWVETLEGSVTQVVDQKTLVRLVYSLTAQQGFMEKPYRSVPLFDDAGLAAAAAMGGIDADNYEQFRLAARPLEEVPDSRVRHALGVRGLRYLAPIGGSVKLDYRFYIDSWGISAHTAEPALRLGLTDWLRLDLWSRLHWQSSADFWQKAYRVSSDSEIPALRSSDRSLSKSWHLTGAARLAFERETLSAYLETGVMYSRFPEFLFLDSRIAIISQTGIRWRF